MFNPLETLETRELFSAVPGIYSEGELLTGERYAVRADANLIPSVRNALDEGRVDLEVVLDPGATYQLQPLDASSGRAINDLYLEGDKLTIRTDPAADADGSGGRAQLSVLKSAEGARWNPFLIDPDQGGDLTLRGVDLAAADQTPDERLWYVLNHGAGTLTLDDASIAPPRLRPGLPDPDAPLHAAGAGRSRGHLRARRAAHRRPLRHRGRREHPALGAPRPRRRPPRRARRAGPR